MAAENKFKKEREKKGLTLKQVSKEIKITVDKLKAIEEDDLSNFPGKFYVKGFLKTYADFLGIKVDIDEKLKKIDLSKDEIEDSIKKTRETQEYSEEKEKRINISNLIGALIILGLIIYGGYQFIENKYKVIGMEQETAAVKKPVIKSTSTEIFLKGVINKPTWVRVVSDGELDFERVLSTNTVHYWHAKNSLKINIGYVPGMELYYKNKKGKEYKKVNIQEGSEGDINELEFFNETIR
ncbi:MAG: RodZ domain-containing protein [Elusimicrobiota bacterium]